LTYEKKGSSLQKAVIPGGDSDSDVDDPDAMTVPDRDQFNNQPSTSTHMDIDDDVGEMDDDDEDDNVPLVVVGSERIPINQVNEDVIAKMTPSEKERDLCSTVSRLLCV